MMFSPIVPVSAAPPAKKANATVAPATSNAKKGKTGTPTANTKKGKAQGAVKQDSKAELQKRQQSAQAEVRKTQEELKQNEAEVKKNLSELSLLEDGIANSKKETDALSSEVGKLSGKIATLEKSIASENKQLTHLRTEYLKAVKKMRVSRKRNSKMAYLFSAKDLAQAERRMRYLKEFSEWKDRKTGEINAKVAKLKKENEELQQAKSDKKVILGREMQAQNKLNEQKQRQDILVAELKANGDVLRDHLAKKQAEVNALKGQVAAVIAEEQRKAEAERKRKEEAAKAAAAKKAAEEAAAKEAAAKRAAEEATRKKAAEEAAKKKAAEEAAKKEAAKKEAPKKEPVKKEAPKKESPKKEEPKTNTTSNTSKGDYAAARKRKPRNTQPKETPKETTKETKAPVQEKVQQKETPAKPAPAPASSGNGFASKKGSLPRPVDGAFRITGKFGRHALPDLPDVTYDNPGIDVEVAKGANVKCVYEGTVSGVYMVPGFSTVIIVSHGDYYTVYGNVASASVKVGDQVSQGKVLGKLAEDPDNRGHSTLHFEVWKGREKTNPQSWIR